MLTLWGRLSSINVQKVVWTLLETGVAFERIDVGGRFGGLSTAEFLARNPHGRIPVIDDDGVVVWESNAIVRHLSARYSAGGFWPSEPGPRALADAWMDWCATTLQPAFMGFFFGWWRTPENERDAGRNAALLAAANQQFGVLDRILEPGRFLVGEGLTVADIPAGAMLYRYFTLDIERPRLPSLEDWYGALRERPSYRQSVMSSYAELKGRLA